MKLSLDIARAYSSILKEELLVAMGCTEPISIAYAASILRKALGKLPTSVQAELSGNIIKNVKSVIVPATGGLHGIEAAIAAGVIANAAEKELEVLSSLQDADRENIASFLDNCPITVSELDSIHTFDLQLTGSVQEHQATVRISKNHTNVVLVSLDGEDITAQHVSAVMEEESHHTDRSVLNVQDIVAFAEAVDLDELAPLIRRQIDMNMAIAEEGLRGEYGASIGKVLYRDGSATLRDRARAYAAAGSFVQCFFLTL